MGHQQAVDTSVEQFKVAVRALEKIRGCRIWNVVHTAREHHICYPLNWAVKDAWDEDVRGEKVEMLLHSPGGHPEIAYAAVRFLRKRFKEVNAIVPLSAKSAATIMCLGADKIFMGELADLGPIDIQIDDEVQHGSKSFSPLDEFKSLEFLREQALQWSTTYARVVNMLYGLSLKEGLRDSLPLVVGMMKPLFEQIEPLEMGGHRRALAIGEEYANRMLALTGHPDAAKVVKHLVWDYPAHNFRIDIDEARDMGLPVEPLPREQDKLITTVLMGLEYEEAFHGFLQNVPVQTAEHEVRGGARKKSAPRKRAGQRVNGRDQDSERERR